MPRVVTDRFLSVGLNGRGSVMSNFYRLMNESISPNRRNENRFRRQKNPRLKGIELKPVSGLSF